VVPHSELSTSTGCIIAVLTGAGGRASKRSLIVRFTVSGKHRDSRRRSHRERANEQERFKAETKSEGNFD